MADAARRACNGWLSASAIALVATMALPGLRDSEGIHGLWLALTLAFLALLQQRFRLWADASNGLGIVARELGVEVRSDPTARRRAMATGLLPTIAGLSGLAIGVIASTTTADTTTGRDMAVAVFIALMFIGPRVLPRIGRSSPGSHPT